MKKPNANVAGVNRSPASKDAQVIPLEQIRLSRRYQFRKKIDEKTVSHYKKKNTSMP